MRTFGLGPLPLLALSLVGCSNPMVLVDVDIDFLPMDTQQLLLVTTLNGQPGKEQRFRPDERRLAVNLPDGASGTVALHVYGMDAGECILTEGGIEVPVPSSFNRTEQHSIKMSRPSKPKCSFTSMSTNWPSPPNLKAVWGSDPDNMFVVGGGSDGTNWKGLVIRCGSTSTACTVIDSKYTAANSLYSYLAVWGSDASNVFSVDGNGHIVRCSSESASCAEIHLTKPYASLFNIWGHDLENIYAVGNRSPAPVLRCSASKNSCAELNSNTGQPLSGIWGTSAEHVYAAGGTEIVRCRGTSEICEKLTITNGPAAGNLLKVWASDSSNVYAVSRGGSIVRCTAETSACTLLESGTTADLHAIWGSDPNNVYAVGDSVIVRCRAEMNKCTSLDPGIARAFRAVWGSDANNVYVVGSGGAIVRCTAGSNICTQLKLVPGVSPNFSSVYGTDSNNIYVVGDGAILRRRL